MADLLPTGSLVLVSGANGYIGSHVCDQLLKHGYRVRGTVRDPSTQGWLQDMFDAAHGKGKFELVRVADIFVEGCFDEAVKGCDAFNHCASDLSLSADPTLVVEPVVRSVKTALAAAATEPKMKRFVLTSSSRAATKTYPNQPFHIDRTTWNEADIAESSAPPPYEQSRMWANYGASKALGEQALWRFVDEQKPRFTANAVLPNANFGKLLDPEHQDGRSTSGWITGIFKGGFEQIAQMVEPQWYVDVVDTALLHVAALTDLSMHRERLFAYAEPFTWNQVLGILRKLRPDADLPADVADDSRDLSTVENGPARKILQERLGREGWTTLEESLKENIAHIK